MATNLFIPKKIKVGFQKRSDTYTGKLAYVIYFDETGKLRKETSWKGWIDPKITAVEFDNVPSKFIFNKDVSRHGYFGSGRSVMRVYDERDFEFEIGLDNLTGILMHSDISKRDIVEPCVFAWSGKDLVLLPTNSEEYQESLAYTKKQSEKVSAKELVKGHTYNMKKSEDTLVYLGYFQWWDRERETGNSYRTKKICYKNKGKKHVFYSNRSKQIEARGINLLSSVCSDEIVSNYAELVDKFYKKQEAWPMVDYKICKATGFNKRNGYMYLYKEVDGVLLSIYLSEHNTTLNLKENANLFNVLKSDDGVVFEKTKEQLVCDDNRNSYHYRNTAYPAKAADILNPIEAEIEKVPNVKIVNIRYGTKYETYDLAKIMSVLEQQGFGVLNVYNEKGTNWVEDLS